ncbi:MAG: hypothetical protein OJF47_000177 [Nitrospira sp.]|jgi:hypothetical protein|nr:MAG: hypothetical protein OJF47_000177 [Nitrospira sp.]
MTSEDRSLGGSEIRSGQVRKDGVKFVERLRQGRLTLVDACFACIG